MSAEASRQSSTVSGGGNNVVQIVGSGNAVTVLGAVGLRLTKYLEGYEASAPLEVARAGQAGWTITGRREIRILSPFNRESISFQGQAPLLSGLKDWLCGPETVSVHAITGAGGRGKTRLAVELAQWAREAGWTAGFARRSDLDIFRNAGCRTEWHEHCLVIVDYAAAKSGEIAAWLRSLAHENLTDRQPLRLLLVERTGGESIAWWRKIFEAGDLEGAAVKDLLATGAPLTLEALSSPKERHAVFAAAYRQASAQAPPERSTWLDQSLAEVSLGGAPLFLAMFGLVAARQGLNMAMGLEADGIARDLALQELERIGRIWKSHGLPIGEERPLHVHLAAVATLCEGLSEVETGIAIARESLALKQAIAADQTEPARAALYAALPGVDGGIAAIVPDIIGEAAMIEAFGQLPDTGVEIVRRASAQTRARVLRMVVRACQDFLIRGKRTPLAWLKVLQADTEDLGDLLALADAMPAMTLELREIALDLSEEVLMRIREIPGESGELLRAGALNNLSNRFAALGRGEDALAAITKTVEIYRILAAARPNAVLPNLAGALNNLSGCLAALGHRENALAANEEAVEIFRILAAGKPDAFRPDLAGTLNNLSNCLAARGHRENALAACEEAVEILRILAAAEPDVFRPDLAMSLNNLSGCLTALEHREDALAASEEAVKIRRILAAARPDAFRPNLAMSLNNLSNCLAALGHREDALAASKEAVEIYQILADARPDAFQPNLAMSLNNRSGCLAALGRKEDALAASEEAVEIYQTLADARPDAFQPNLAMSLNNLSGCLAALGRKEDALAANEEAVEIYRTLAEARPDAFADPLSISLWVMADHLDAVGNNTAAIEANRTAIVSLAPLFYRHVAALAPKIGDMVKEYLQRCERAGLSPDEHLLAPIAAHLEALQSEETSTDEGT